MFFSQVMDFPIPSYYADIFSVLLAGHGDKQCVQTALLGTCTESAGLGPLLQPALLVDLQMVALAALYLEGSGSPYATAWLLGFYRTENLCFTQY